VTAQPGPTNKKLIRAAQGAEFWNPAPDRNLTWVPGPILEAAHGVSKRGDALADHTCNYMYRLGLASRQFTAKSEGRRNGDADDSKRTQRQLR
jgi:hypothetical protein